MSDDGKPWANLGFQETQAVYESPSQNARVWTENWVSQSLFCPNCGRPEISKYANNRPVADFACLNCQEEYELKSKKGRFGPSIVDGAYGTMMQRLDMSFDEALRRFVQTKPEEIEPPTGKRPKTAKAAKRLAPLNTPKPRPTRTAD